MKVTFKNMIQTDQGKCDVLILATSTQTQEDIVQNPRQAWGIHAHNLIDGKQMVNYL